MPNCRIPGGLLQHVVASCNNTISPGSLSACPGSGGKGKGHQPTKAGRKLLCGGGGGDTEAHFPNPPPPPSLAAVTVGGGSWPGCPTCHAGGGGGVNPTSMAQNDTHVALIILTTQMWGGKLLVEKFFRAKFCVPVPLAPTSVLTQNKGPDTEPHFSNPPPLLRRASMSPPPPPPPRSNFQVALCHPIPVAKSEETLSRKHMYPPYEAHMGQQF